MARVTPTGVEAVYRKRHPWEDQPGRLSVGDDLNVAASPFDRVGLLVCYDLNFPELGLAYARRVDDVLAIGSPWRTPFRHDWGLLSRARGLERPVTSSPRNTWGTSSARYTRVTVTWPGPEGRCSTKPASSPGAAVAAFSPEALAEARQHNPVHRHRRAVEWPESGMARRGPAFADLVRLSTPTHR